MRKTCGYLPKDSLYTEPELMLLISKGDPYAFRQLFTAYSPQVYTFCVKLTKDAELARDLTQEIFARLARAFLVGDCREAQEARNAS